MPPRRSRSLSRRGRIAASVVAIAVACAVLAASVVAVSMRSAAVERVGAEERASASPAPSITSAPSSTPVVTVISDEFSTAAELAWPTPEWPVQVGRTLGVKVYSLSSGGSGYAVQPQNYEFGGTFLAKASEVAPDSRVVVFFGGANDTRARLSTLRTDSVKAIATAKQAAPDAEIVVVGPASTAVTPPEQVLQIRDTLRRSAATGGARWVDPIAGRWLSSESGVVGADGQSLTRKGELVLAHEFTALLRPLVD